jgi:hypothetical protein
MNNQTRHLAWRKSSRRCSGLLLLNIMPDTMSRRIDMASDNGVIGLSGTPERRNRSQSRIAVLGAGETRRMMPRPSDAMRRPRPATAFRFDGNYQVCMTRDELGIPNLRCLMVPPTSV